MDNKTPPSTHEAGATACYTDVITIQAPLARITEHLTELRCHPSWVPDGFKLYQLQSRDDTREGATAALQLNLLGHWMPGTLRIDRATAQEVVWSLTLEYVSLRAHFRLSERTPRTEVTLNVSTGHRNLPFWRLRSRIKRHLRLERDAVTLFDRCLSCLKQAVEKETTGEPTPSTGASGAPDAASSGTGPASASLSVPSLSVPSLSVPLQSASSMQAVPETSSSAPAREGGAGRVTVASASTGTGAVSNSAPEKGGTEKNTTEPGAPAKPVVVKPMAASVSIRRPVIPAAAEPAVEEKKVVMGAASRPGLERVDALPVDAPPTAAASSAGKGEGPAGNSAPSAQGKASKSGSAASGAQAVFAASELEVGKGRSVVINGRKIAVFRVEEGFFALADQCPHRHNPLATGTLSGCTVTCAAHGWSFDVTNGTSTNVMGAGVLRFEASVRDGQVWVNPRPLRPVFPSE